MALLRSLQSPNSIWILCVEQLSKNAKIALPSTITLCLVWKYLEVLSFRKKKTKATFYLFKLLFLKLVNRISDFGWSPPHTPTHTHTLFYIRLSPIFANRYPPLSKIWDHKWTATKMLQLRSFEACDMDKFSVSD